MASSHGLGGRLCENCGYKMPVFQPRRRDPESGKLLCPGCHPDGKGNPHMPVGLHGSMVKGAPFAGYEDFDACVAANGDKDDPSAYCATIMRNVEGALRFEAHDSGDGETIYHCPFCGGGNVIARSDGTTECGFCQAAFTVQVQPMHPNMPQTIDGVPVNQPGMPGQPGEPGDVPGSEGDSTVFEPPDATAPAFEPPDQAAPVGGPTLPSFQPIAASKRYFVTAKGVALDEDAFIRHLAINFADDRDEVIEQVRQSRG